MHRAIRCVIWCLCIAAALIFGIWHYLRTELLADALPPRRLPDFYWGHQDVESDDEMFKPDQITITVDHTHTNVIHRKIKEELGSSRLFSTPENTGFRYGFNSDFLNNLLNHWLKIYNWPERQKGLNSIPQYYARISGLRIHYLFHSPTKVDEDDQVVTLLLIHGWPGSFVEFKKVAKILKSNENVKFEIVIPSIPGFGFSEPTKKVGLGPLEIGQIFLKLMLNLGKRRFYVHGSGWGSLIATSMALVFPKHVLGLHSTFCFTDHPRSHFKLLMTAMIPQILSEQDENVTINVKEAMVGLFHQTNSLFLQATKPDALGIGMSMSPIALVAWLLEKFSSWTSESCVNEDDGCIMTTFNLDDLIDNVMIYWVSNSATYAFRFFTEAFSKRQRSYGLDRAVVKVPTGCLVPANDPLQFWSKSMIKDKYGNLIHYTKAPTVGHFVTLESPQLLAEDIVVFILRTLGKSGKSKMGFLKKTPEL